MTGDASQILVLGDEAVYAWLRDRFGIDVARVLMADGFVITAKKGEAVMLHLDLFVGADDLAAFPRAE